MLECQTLNFSLINLRFCNFCEAALRNIWIFEKFEKKKLKNYHYIDLPFYSRDYVKIFWYKPRTVRFYEGNLSFLMSNGSTTDFRNMFLPTTEIFKWFSKTFLKIIIGIKAFWKPIIKTISVVLAGSFEWSKRSK